MYKYGIVLTLRSHRGRVVTEEIMGNSLYVRYTRHLAIILIQKGKCGVTVGSLTVHVRPTFRVVRFWTPPTLGHIQSVRHQFVFRILPGSLHVENMSIRALIIVNDLCE